MSSNVENSGDDPRLQASAQEPGGENRSCSVCKTPLSADSLGEFCPVCMLRSALIQTLELGEEKLIVSPELRFRKIDLNIMNLCGGRTALRWSWDEVQWALLLRQ